MMSLTGVDTNGYNLAYKDPLIWGRTIGIFRLICCRHWLIWSGASRHALADSLPQVHKHSHLCHERGAAYQNIGSNTWAGWTGDIQPDSFSGQYLDAALMAPVSDWRLAGLLTSLLNTNDATRLFSVNDPNTTDWQNLFNGLIVYSNSTAAPYRMGRPPSILM